MLNYNPKTSKLAKKEEVKSLGQENEAVFKEQEPDYEEYKRVL